MQTYTSHRSVILKESESFLYIHGKTQLLHFITPLKTYRFHITTAAKGFGETHNSFRTPRGWHYIRAIIGTQHPIHTYFKGRRPCHQATDISGRILWLCGLEPRNHEPSKHSMLRYIYIHGTDKAFLKTPTSLGCINMSNHDVCRLAHMLPTYCKVYIDYQ